MSESAKRESFLAKALRSTGIYQLARDVISTVEPQTAFFSPGQPLEPSGPARDIGRQMDFPVGFNIRIEPRAGERVSFYELRYLADNHDITRLLIETRKDQIESLGWSFVPVDEPKSASARKDITRRIDKLTEFFQYPDGFTPFGTWLRSVLEDLLVIDAPTVYIDREDPYSTKFRVLDGATIKRNLDEWGRTPEAPDPAYQQIIRGVPAFNYTTDQILYMPRNVRASRVYGFSPVEQLVTIINIGLRKELWQLDYFAEGNIPDMLIGVPETWTPEQISTYQRQWDVLHEGNLAQRRKAKFVPGGTKPMPTRPTELKDPFDEWLARIACYAFSIPPTPFVQGSNRSVAMVSKQTAEDEGLRPLRRWTKQFLDTLAQVYLNQDDIEFQWAAPIESDPQKHIAVIDTQLRNGLLTINEGRLSLGREPVEGGDVPLIFTSSGPIPVSAASTAWKARLMGPSSGAQPNTREPQEQDGEGYTNQEKAPNRPLPKQPRGTIDVTKLYKAANRTLYIHRPLVNADDLLAWAAEQGFESVLTPEDLHVTVAYSKQPVSWDAVGTSGPILAVGASMRKVEALGDKGAVVLMFESSQLQNRHQQIIDAGASWDYESYTPHITITYNAGDLNLLSVDPYDGDLIFGPEVFAEVNDNYMDDLKEQTLKANSPHLLLELLSEAEEGHEAR